MRSAAVDGNARARDGVMPPGPRELASVQRAAPHHHAGSGRNCGRRRDRYLDGIARIDVKAV
jgi:hypothetical protein